MPTSTYYNLSVEKKEKIEKAVKREFARVPLIDMSVKNIVTDAKIARGSFYQYFETREDLINYMLEKEFEKEEAKFLDKYIDMQSINITSMDEVYATIRIISIITFSKKMDILNKKVTKEKGLTEYRQELEIIKKGLLR